MIFPSFQKMRKKKKKRGNWQGSQDPPRKKQNFRNEEDFIFAKKPPKKTIFPPATSGRRALRARLPDSHRAERRSILRDNKKRKPNPFSCTIRSTNRTKPIRLPEAGADATAGYLKKNDKIFAALVKLYFLAEKCKGIQRHCQLYFFAEQKN